MKYPKHVMAIKPGYRWECGRRHVGFLRVETDLPCPATRIMTRRNLLPC